MFQKTGNQLRVVIKGHDEFVEEVQHKIDRFKKKEMETRSITTK